MELVRIATLVVFLLFLVLSCEGLPVGDAEGQREGEEIDQALAMANSALDLLELDIIEEEAEGRRRRDTVADSSKLWPGGVVPYVLPSFISDEAKSLVESAMEHWMNHTCIEFVKRGTERDYILFVESVGCWSSVGRQGGEQMLSVGDRASRKNGCGKMGVVVHELAHALGFWHEQSRMDRDDHVVIVQANIHPMMRRNFRKYTHELTDPLGVKYDYDSIMHYGERAFSMNGRPTIVPTKEGAKIGQRSKLSPLDIKQANMMYNCTVKAQAVPEPPPDLLHDSPSGVDQQLHLVLKNTGSSKCLAAQGGEVVLEPCNSSLLTQQWMWNDAHQLASYDSKLCLTSGKNSGVLLEPCVDQRTATQEWLCAGHHIVRPTDGECLSSQDLPQGGDELEEMIQELQGFLQPPKAARSMCTLNEPSQKWQIHNTVGGGQTADLRGRTPCAASASNVLQQCYNETRSDGQLKCRYQGMFAKGLLHATSAGCPLEGLECCASPRMFTGSPDTVLHPSDLSCVHEPWLQASPSRETRGFTCPKGYYLTSITYGKGESSEDPQSATCCTDRSIKALQAVDGGHANEPPLASYVNCYPPDVSDGTGSHLCHTGYYITYAFREKCDKGECQEEIKCCF